MHSVCCTEHCTKVLGCKRRVLAHMYMILLKQQVDEVIKVKYQSVHTCHYLKCLWFIYVYIKYCNVSVATPPSWQYKIPLNFFSSLYLTQWVHLQNNYTAENCCMSLSKCENLLENISILSQSGEWVGSWGSDQSLALAFRTFAHSSSSAAAHSCLEFSAPLKRFLYPSRNDFFCIFYTPTTNKSHAGHYKLFR